MSIPKKFPDNVEFEWVPIEDTDPTACGRPQAYNASKEFAGKKVVLVSVPGAFTPGCQGVHIPPFMSRTKEMIDKKVDLVVVIAYNDGWVMSAWGKVNGANGDGKVKFMSDTKSKFSQQIGWTVGERTARYAMIIDDGNITYAEKESGPGQITVSSFDSVLAKL